MQCLILQEYTIKIQVPGKGSSDNWLTVGKATVDLASHVADSPKTIMLPVTFKVGGSTTGYLRLILTSILLKGSEGDEEMAFSEVSGLTGLTSEAQTVHDQDLAGALCLAMAHLAV